MKINNSEQFFKVQIKSQFNKSTEIKIWSSNVVQILNVDGIDLECFEYFIDDDKYVSSFLFNKYYKAQIKDLLNDFANLNFNFSPALLVEHDFVQVVPVNCVDEYFFDEKCLLNIKEIEREYKNLILNFQANWDYLNNVFASAQEEIATYSLQKLKNKLPLKGEHKRVSILDFNITPRTVQWIEDDNKFGNFFSIQNCELDCLIKYYYVISRKESVSFRFFNDNFNQGHSDEIPNSKLDGSISSSALSTKTINYQLKLPCKESPNNWFAGALYQEGDVIFYDNDAYKCLVQHLAFTFENQNWEKVNNKQYLSFNNNFSFFESEYGQKCYEKILNALPLVIEDHVSQKIHLKLLSDQIPTLNQCFVYKDKTFRIVKFEYEFCDQQNVLNIYGVRVLENFALEKRRPYLEDYVALDYFEESTGSGFNWVESAVKPSHELRIYNANGEKEVFEGISIRTPKNFSMESVAKIHIKGNA
ncbi:MAG: hypothetical protein WC755_09410 [Candidatus Woesearchaeota archaeon]|jgi:hypothetical protein